MTSINIAQEAENTNLDAIKRWEKVSQKLRTIIGEDHFGAWCERLELFSVKELCDVRRNSLVTLKVTISAPSVFVARWVQEHYAKTISDIWAEGTDFQVQVIVANRKMERQIGTTSVVPAQTLVIKKGHKYTQDSLPVSALSTSGVTQPKSGKEYDPELSLSATVARESIPVAILLWHVLWVLKHNYGDDFDRISNHNEGAVLPRYLGLYLGWLMTGNSLDEIKQVFWDETSEVVEGIICKIDDRRITNLEIGNKISILKSHILKLAQKHPQIPPELISQDITLLVTNKKRISVNDVQLAVLKYYRISMAELLSSRRTRGIVGPRQVAMYLAKVLTLRSLVEIGHKFGDRDHTTVLHAFRKMEAICTAESEDLGDDKKKLRQDIQILKLQLSSP